MNKGWQNAMNILCIRLDSLGDVLMTVPALRALKAGVPGRKLTLLTSPSGAKAAPLIPEIDDTIIYEAPWMKAPRPSTGSRPEFEIIGMLQKKKFDAAVIFTVFSQNPLPAAMISFMAEIPLRLSYCRENPYNLLTDWISESDHIQNTYIRHEVRRQLDLVVSIGARTENQKISLSLPDDALREGARILDSIQLNRNNPWLVLHPGATAPSRRYPAENFAWAAEKLASEYGFQILFTGTEPEVGLVESIRTKMKASSFSLAGMLGISEFSSVISMAPLLVSNNTGPVHIAAALETPVVDLYALTNPQHTPWKVLHRTLYCDVPCKFCYKSVCPMKHHNCLRLVSHEAVVKAAVELFESGRKLRMSEKYKQERTWL